MSIDRPRIPAFSVTSGQAIDWPKTPEQTAESIAWRWFNALPNAYTLSDRSWVERQTNPLADALREKLIPAIAEAIRAASKVKP